MNFHDNDELKPQWYFSSHGHFFLIKKTNFQKMMNFITMLNYHQNEETHQYYETSFLPLIFIILMNFHYIYKFCNIDEFLA